MKVRDVIKRLRADGWGEVRRRGDHRVWQHPDKPGNVIVAGAPGTDVPVGTLRAIYKQAGWRYAE